MASSNANSTVLPAFIKSQVLLPIHLNPVSVSYIQRTHTDIHFIKLANISSERTDCISTKDSYQ